MSRNSDGLWSGTCLTPFSSRGSDETGPGPPSGDGNHDPERFEEFGRRYQAELAEPKRVGALAHLRELASGRGVTLLTATRQPESSEAAILARLLRDLPNVG